MSWGCRKWKCSEILSWTGLVPKLSSSRSVYSLGSQSRAEQRGRRGGRDKHTDPERDRRSRSPQTSVWFLLIHLQTSRNTKTVPLTEEEGEERVTTLYALSLSFSSPLCTNMVMSSSRSFKGKSHHHHKGHLVRADGLCSPLKHCVAVILTDISVLLLTESTCTGVYRRFPAELDWLCVCSCVLAPEN